MGRTTARGGMRRWGGRRRPRAAPVERVPTAGGGQGRAGGGQRLKEVFLDLCGRRSCGGGDGGDGEADPREGKKKLDENVVLVSFFLGVEICI
jgi:hypothetical protein